MLFAIDGDDLIVDAPSALTADDRAGLRRWKRHVLAMITYQVPVSEVPQ